MASRRSHNDEAGPSRGFRRSTERKHRRLRLHANIASSSEDELKERARSTMLRRRRAFVSRVHFSDDSGTHSREENRRLRGQSPLSGRVAPERERSVSQESSGWRVGYPLDRSVTPPSSVSPQYSPLSSDSEIEPMSPPNYRMSPDTGSEPQHPEYGRESRGYVREDVTSNGGEVDVEGNHGMTFSDPDVLDCPLCVDPLTIPVFQCENGHIACSTCSTKIGNKCHSCTLPFGHIRCRAIEKVIESLKVSCPNFKYGCMEKTSYCDKIEHENKCVCSPCSCPMVSCTFIGSLKQLFEHFTSTHAHMARSFSYDDSFSIVLDESKENVVLQEKEGELFILNREELWLLGNSLNVSCIQPRTSKLKFPYMLVVEKDNTAVKLKSVADNVAVFQDFLIVPQHFFDSRGDLKVKIRISNPIPIA